MEENVEELLKKTFLKLRSDYGFKRAFTSGAVLKKFLNALFEGKMEVTEITFENKEILPPDENGKRIYYDAYCTTSTGNHFVVEMQRKQSKDFGQRMVFYISSCVFRQGERGKSYRFSPVYLIVVTDFDMRPLEGRLVNEVVLMERDTHVVFSEAFHIFFLSLSRVSQEWDDCKTELERQLYLIKNMENLNKNSKPYKTGEYDELFNASEMANMAMEDIVEYRNSVMAELERESELEFAREEGIEIGREEGREEGKMEERKAMAGKMKKNGLSLGDILLYTGLSEEEYRLL